MSSYVIRKATVKDLDAVETIYNKIHEAEEEKKQTTGWIRGVYPARQTAEEALQRDDLYVLEAEGKILGAAIINQIQPDVYAKGAWTYAAQDNKVCVLHTLVISPDTSGQGYGRAFVKFYEAYAKEIGCRELRMDTNEKNTAARGLYRKLGYREVGIWPTVFNGIPNVNLVLLEKYLSEA